MKASNEINVGGEINANIVFHHCLVILGGNNQPGLFLWHTEHISIGRSVEKTSLTLDPSQPALPIDLVAKQPIASNDVVSSLSPSSNRFLTWFKTAACKLRKDQCKMIFALGTSFQ
jgi:hypothetical protein